VNLKSLGSNPQHSAVVVTFKQPDTHPSDNTEALNQLTNHVNKFTSPPNPTQ